MPRIRVHDTRCTCASLPAVLDAYPRMAMQILRHSQIAVTMNFYTKRPRPRRWRRPGGWETAWMGDRLLYFPAVLAGFRALLAVKRG